jgi:hypothetical protein
MFLTASKSYKPQPPEYHLNERQYRQFVKFEEEEIKTLSKAEQKELRKDELFKASGSE